MLGYAAAVTSIGGILFQMLGGFLGNIHWQYCFLAADLSIPFYIFALVFIPDKPVKRPEPGRSEKGFGQALQAPLLLLGLFMILWELLYFVFLTNSALYLVNSGIADTAQVGVITAMVTIGGMVMSFLYGRLVRVFHEKLLPLAYLMTAVGFFVLCLSGNAVMAGIGAFAIGIGYGISAPCQLNFASLLVPKEAASVATFRMLYCQRDWRFYFSYGNVGNLPAPGKGTGVVFLFSWQQRLWWYWRHLCMDM